MVLSRLLTPLLLMVPGLAAQQLCGEPVAAEWLTTPERTKWQKTSTSQDVAAFLRRLQAAHPEAFQLDVLGHTLQGRPIRVAKVQRQSESSRLRAVIIANIHGGEIEGKESVQVLLREIALGGHASILAACDLWFVPIFNVDGNDEMHPSNRQTQNGPPVVGKRSNSQGLDLNRDFVKVESPEARALLGLIREVDPHLFMDLHTTNGSPHGYHLTYSPSLATNLFPGLDVFQHSVFIPGIRAAMRKKHGFRIFDYGNFPRTRTRTPASWTTYDHKPRLVFNYFGLRNRLSLLSEAYSYLPFRKRALVTRAFVLESLHQLIAQRERVERLCELADRDREFAFGFKSRLRKPVRQKVLVGNLEREGRRSIATDRFEPVEMDVRVRFEATNHIAMPSAWAIPGASDKVQAALLIHGVTVQRLTAPVTVKAERFVVEGLTRPRMVYQGHRLVTLRGKLEAGTHELPAGTLIVPRHQRLARVAAQLLEGHSEDSLATWEFFDATLRGEEPRYPVLRVLGDPGLQTVALRLTPDLLAVRAAYALAPAELPADTLQLELHCTAIGERISGGGFESRIRWRGRRIVWQLGDARIEDETALQAALRGLLSPKKRACVLKPGPAITNAELVAAAGMLEKLGATRVYLRREPE